jgi:hypothetical protein
MAPDVTRSATPASKREAQLAPRKLMLEKDQEKIVTKHLATNWLIHLQNNLGYSRTITQTICDAGGAALHEKNRTLQIRTFDEKNACPVGT